MKLTFAASRRLWWGIPLLLVLLACLGALLPQWGSELPQPPAFTTVALPIVRFIRDIAAAITVGALAVGGLLVKRQSSRVIGWATWWALVWLVSLVAEVVLTFSDILAVIPSLDGAALGSFLTDVSVGRVFLWQGIAVLVVLAMSRAVLSRPTAWVVLACALGGAMAPAFLGHGGLSGGHAAATISLALHLAAVSLWVGGLVVVVAWLRVDPARARTVLPRFSTLALVCVVVVAESGLLNSSLRSSTPAQFLASDYGALLVAKATLIVWLVTLGWQQRKRVMPQLELAESAESADSTDSLSVVILARIAGWEFLAMGAAVAVGVTMARVGPDSAAASALPVNPLMLALLAAALPAAFAQILRPSSDRALVRWAQQFPEIVAILLAIIVVEVAGVAVLSSLLGPDVGAVVGAVVLVACGWLGVVALQGERSKLARGAFTAAWVVALGVTLGFERAQFPQMFDVRLSVLALAVAVVSVMLVGVGPVREVAVTQPLEPAHG
ncbi:MAG: CopD family protein [Actinobacteria bacterium]|nr:CopD family protein [Actinomycetota bacterium]